MLQNFLSHWVESADGLDRLLLQLAAFLRNLTTEEGQHHRPELKRNYNQHSPAVNELTENVALCAMIGRKDVTSRQALSVNSAARI